MRHKICHQAFRISRHSRFFYEESWVALNWRITPPTEKTHPKFPLWENGYSPEEVYDLFFPKGFRFICDPGRPAVCGRFGNGEERLFRFEFVVKKDEDPWQMATRENTSKIWLPYMTHSGSKYGYEIPRVVALFSIADFEKAVRSKHPISRRLHRGSSIETFQVFRKDLQQMVIGQDHPCGRCCTRSSAL